MVIGIIILNLLVALYGFYLTRQLWKLRRAFSQAADALTLAEYHTHKLLNSAPSAIERRELGIHHARQTYQQLEPRFEQVQQALAVLGMGRSLFFNPMVTQRLRKSATKRMNR